MHQDGYIYRTMVWITRLAYLNMLWIIFSIVGFIIFGLFPATTAMYAVERKWIRGNTSFAILPYFWSVYKKNFKDSNFIGLPFLLICSLIWINLQITEYMSPFIGNVLLFFLFSLCFLLIIVFLYVFPTFTHYDVRLIETIIFSFIIALSAPLQTILIIVNVLGFFLITLVFPGVFFLFAGSATSLITMWFAYRAMTRIETQREFVVRQ
ncbi:YesL family protein [Gracilibacillus xinjiangensis]|uniref:YesL family protein n=1 Tax=Gracilibacillus xinjiangensis TaxID=1193282 RepID=A0ABV8WTS3_9BACI